MNGRIVAVFGNMVVAEADGRVVQNSVGYCCRGDGARLLSEVIRIRGRMADLQVFEETRGLKVGDQVEFRDAMLSVTLGPGLLGQIYDGLQNPLPKLAAQSGYFLKPGLRGLSARAAWDSTPGGSGLAERDPDRGGDVHARVRDDPAGRAGCVHARGVQGVSGRDEGQ